ncbi:MAG: TonB-dependent receptor plug domain-containing protein [Cytophagales bacterium]
MKFLLCFLWVFFFTKVFVSAQDSIVHLREIEVQGSRLDAFGVGSKVTVLDSMILNRFKNGNLADLLSQNNLLFIKTYSPGNLSTPSFRGTGASHTAVLWNGFNIQSPMNGQTDFALLPANFVNNVQIQFGGAGALFGSGAIGGTIHLNNVAVFNKGISAGANASFGSFSNYQQNIGAEISKRRWIMGIKSFHTNSRNDYTFINPSKPNEIQRQANASVRQVGLLIENHFKINRAQNINLLYWYQTANRQLPPTLLAGGNALDFQQDETHRITSQWQKNGRKVTFAIRSAFFSEQIRFTRPQNDTSQNIAYSFINEIENTIFVTQNQSLQVGLNNTHNWANGDNLPTNPVLNRTALFAAYKIAMFKQNLTASVSVREQLSETVFTPITPSLGIVGKIYKEKLKLTSHLSRNYRLPTFNDLHWRQGLTQGNADLQPESGWSQDVGLVYADEYVKPKSKIYFQLATNVFNSNVNQWIYWHDNANGVLGVDNILAVWSRGIEFTAKLNVKKGDFSFFADANFDYTVATIEKADAKNAATIGKQLIYTPYNKAFIDFGASWKRISLVYNHAFTGFRYSSEDNAQFLSAFQVGNVSASYQLCLRNFEWQFFGKINNVWSENYQVLASRPMPLVNFQLGISIKAHS